MKKPPILIAGGGIAGLAASLALAKTGQASLILEQVIQFEAVGQGLQLGPNAVRALQALNAWDAVEPITSSPPEIHIRDGVSGRLLKRLALGRNFERRFGAPYRVAHRADLHAALLDCARDRSEINLRNSATVAGFEEHDNLLTVKLKNACIVEGASLIAADGVNSTIRQIVFPGSVAIDCGETYHRSLVELPKAVDAIAFDCVNLWLCPGAHVVHYPVGQMPKLNLVAITPKNQSIANAFEICAPSLQQLLSHAHTWSRWPGLYVNPLPSWQSGRIALIGDAAHGTLPYLAQGAAMALEDAAALSAADSRIVRTTRLHQQTLRAGHLYHATGARRAMQNYALRAAPSRVLLQSLDWIYKK